MNLQTSGLEGIRRLVKMTMENGLSEEDYSALFNSVNPER